VSSESSCTVRLARHSQNAWARHVERVEPSSIWANQSGNKVGLFYNIWARPQGAVCTIKITE